MEREQYNTNIIGYGECVKQSAVEKIVEMMVWTDLSDNFDYDSGDFEGEWGSGFVSRQAIEGVFGDLNDLDIEILQNTLEDELRSSDVTEIGYDEVADYIPNFITGAKYNTRASVDNTGITVYIILEDFDLDDDYFREYRVDKYSDVGMSRMDFV